MEIFKNEQVKVIRSHDCIQWYDRKDIYNDYKGFTRNKRGLNKATQFIQQLAQDERLKYDLSMGDVTTLLDKFKLKPHTYCGMD